jgi:hypothetical protein
MTADPNDTNPYSSPTEAGNLATPPIVCARPHLPWGLMLAIPLFVYGAVALVFGGCGLLFLPGIMMGGVSIGENTTLLKVVVWVLVHAVAVTHGYVVMVAASSLRKSRWKRAAKAIGIAAALVFLLVIVGSIVNYFG